MSSISPYFALYRYHDLDYQKSLTALSLTCAPLMGPFPYSAIISSLTLLIIKIPINEANFDYRT